MNLKIKKVLVIHGADENNLAKDEEDTIKQALEIKQGLNQVGIQAEVFNLLHPLKSNLEPIKIRQPYAIFNLVEAINGKGKYSYLAPLIFNKTQIPYTGNPSKTIKLTTNKILTKEILRQHQLPTPDWLTLETYQKNFKAADPYIIKSVTEDASIGIDMNSIVHNQNQMEEVIDSKTAVFGGHWFAEKYIEGREFNISILEKNHTPTVLPFAEIIFDDLYNDHYKIVDYASKWDKKSPFYQASNRYFPPSEPFFKQMTDISLNCWKIFNLSGYARIDFRLDKQNNPFILEINANPCLASDSGFVATAQQAGIDYAELMQIILSSAKTFGE